MSANLPLPQQHHGAGAKALEPTVTTLLSLQSWNLPALPRRRRKRVSNQTSFNRQQRRKSQRTTTNSVLKHGAILTAASQNLYQCGEPLFDWRTLQYLLRHLPHPMLHPAHLQLSLNCFIMLLIFSNLWTSRCSLH